MSNRIAQILSEVSDKLQIINRDLERVLPSVDVRAVSAFGNSGHVVLSKKFIDKRVGVIILDDIPNKKNERRFRK